MNSFKMKTDVNNGKVMGSEHEMIAITKVNAKCLSDVVVGLYDDKLHKLQPKKSNY